GGAPVAGGTGDRSGPGERNGAVAAPVRRPRAFHDVRPRLSRAAGVVARGRPGRTLRAGRTRRTLRAGGAGGTLSAIGARIALRAGRTGRTLSAIGTRIALPPGRTGRALGAIGPRIAPRGGRPHIPLRDLRRGVRSRAPR